jgi:hypothetical protein
MSRVVMGAILAEDNRKPDLRRCFVYSSRLRKVGK